MSERWKFGGPGMCDHMYWNDDVENRGETFRCNICEHVFTKDELINVNMSPCCDSLEYEEVD